jgi:hypothetical protein
MSALTRDRSTDTVPNALMQEYYVQRARGGAGLIVSEGTLITRVGWVQYRLYFFESPINVCPINSLEYEHAPGIWDKTQVAAWKKITDAVHDAGSKMYCQVSVSNYITLRAPILSDAFHRSPIVCLSFTCVIFATLDLPANCLQRAVPVILTLLSR